MAAVEEKFRHRVGATPSAPALVDDGLQLTYAQLDAETAQLAARLRALGVTAEQVVAVKVDRRLEAVIAMLAVQKAGGVYLPMESLAPVERTRTILADSGTRVLFVGSTAGDGIPDVPSLSTSSLAGVLANVKVAG